MNLNVFRYGYAGPWYCKPIQFFRNIKYAFQRAKYGFCEYDTFELSEFYRMLISQSLKYFAENTHGYPVELSENEWYDTLYRMANYIENTNPEEMDTPIADDYFGRIELTGKNHSLMVVSSQTTASDETLENLRKMMFAEFQSNNRIAENNLRHGLELLEKYWFSLWD